MEAFIRRRGDEVRLILPNPSVPEEVCRKVAKRLAASLYALLSPLETPPDRVRILGPSLQFCHYCLEPVALPYKCIRCGGLYCGDHRLPEKHDCPGGGGEAAKIPVDGARQKRIEKEREKAVLRIIPCG